MLIMQSGIIRCFQIQFIKKNIPNLSKHKTETYTLFYKITKEIEYITVKPGVPRIPFSPFSPLTPILPGSPLKPGRPSFPGSPRFPLKY